MSDDATADFIGTGPYASIGPIVLYGAGELGELTIAALSRVAVSPAFVVDRKWEGGSKRPSHWQGVRTATLEELSALRGRMTLMIAISRSPLSTVLEESPEGFAGWSSVWTAYDILEHYYPRQPIHNGWTSQDWHQGEWALVTANGELLADDTSRAHYLSALAWRHLRQEWQFVEHPVVIRGNGTQYEFEHSEPVLRTAKSVVDVGCFQGTFLELLRQTSGDWPARYVGFEPDTTTFAQLASRLRHRRVPLSVAIRAEAVAHNNERRLFAGGLGYASRVSSSALSNSYWVDSLSLDSLGLEFDLLKIHSEASDVEALMGSMEGVAANQASILVTMYHSPGAFTRIPQILGQLPGRRLFVRQGGFLGCGVLAFSTPN